MAGVKCLTFNRESSSGSSRQGGAWDNVRCRTQEQQTQRAGWGFKIPRALQTINLHPTTWVVELRCCAQRQSCFNCCQSTARLLPVANNAAPLYSSVPASKGVRSAYSLTLRASSRMVEKKVSPSTGGRW